MPRSAVNAHDSSQRIRAIAQQCVKCGLCLPACPTYQISKTEAESPRGRIAIADAIATGAHLDASAREHLDSCLACGACQAVCPSAVRYQELIVNVRVSDSSHRKESLKRKAARRLLERPKLLRALMPVVRALSPPLNILLKRLVPRHNGYDERKVRSVTPTPLPLVTLFAGCSGAFEETVLIATARLLGRCGFTVRRMRPLCCGALSAHSGDALRATVLADQVQQCLMATAGEISTGVVSGCATQYADIAQSIAPYRDPMELIWSRREHFRFRRDQRTVALHFPCTQRMNPASLAATQHLLQLVPDLKVLTLPHRGRCCGGAGTYFLDHPKTARTLRQPTLDDLASSSADLVLSANIGCRMQLAEGSELMVLHPLEFLAGLLED